MWSDRQVFYAPCRPDIFYHIESHDSPENAITVVASEHRVTTNKIITWPGTLSTFYFGDTESFVIILTGQ